MDARSNDGSRSVVLHELMSSPINEPHKSVVCDYVTDGVTKTTVSKDFTYATTMKRQEFYCYHSNVMLISVNKRKVNYEIYRAKRDEKPVLIQSDRFARHKNLV